MPHSSKHPKNELDQSRLPSASKGMFLGLVWEATCIPACPYMTHQHVRAKRLERNEQWAECFGPFFVGTVVVSRRGGIVEAMP